MIGSMTDIELDEIITKYRPIITFKVKKSIGGQTPDWEDIANEIITNVIDKVKSGEFRGESSLGTYIFTITKRRIIDHIRGKSKILRHAPEADPFPQPHVYFENKERAETLANAIESLKPKYKEILYLYYYKDLSREEVAQKMGIPPNRVSERVNYAQKLLRKILKP
ncbi:MAG: sigma-70 family RNA polymerase sigma factor [Candidatus Aminicenantes bacterium]|nr:sigma-70 family RNA polymerase sigma factor [Candidatus Aminicenantes bacterium]